MNGKARILYAFLCLSLVSLLILLPVAAVPTTTVPDIIQECARDARYPDARFTCVFAEPATRGSSLPEGLPIEVNCIDQTVSAQPVASWRWDFGDGGTSTRQSPAHSFAEAGVYPISLTVTTICGSRYTDTATSGMDVYCIAPEPYFTVDKDEGAAPLTVRVQDGSRYAPEDVTRWTYWLDGTHRSTDRNPVYVYTKPGIYTINLSLTKECVRPGQRVFPPYEHRINVTPAQISLLFLMNISNATPTTLPTTKTTPFSLQTPFALNTGSSTAAPVATTVPAPAASIPRQGDPVAGTGAASPGTGTLTVITDPVGARVYVDDVLRGASPATVPNLGAGSHMLRLERDGYRNMTVPVDISEEKTTAYSTALVPESPGGKGTLPLNPLTVFIGLAGAGGLVVLATRRAP